VSPPLRAGVALNQLT